MGEIMGEGPCNVCLGGSGKEYPLGEALGLEYGAEGGSSSQMWSSIGSIYRAELGSSGEMSGGES